MTLGTLVRHARPARRVARHTDFDRLVNDLLGGFGLPPVPVDTRPPFRPVFDAVELENEYRVSADLPGVEPADLEVTVEDGVLTVRGQRFFDEKRAEGQREPAAGDVSRIDERGRFEQRIRFPGEIDENGVKASYKHGVLTIHVPRPAPATPEVRTIPVETA